MKEIQSAGSQKDSKRRQEEPGVSNATKPIAREIKGEKWFAGGD